MQFNRAGRMTLVLLAMLLLLGTLPAARVRGAIHAAIPLQRPSGPAGIPLERLLKADGTIDVDRGFRGVLDPSGFDLQVHTDGAPRFVPRATLDPADTRWSPLFQRPGVDGVALAIAVDGPNIYVGGDFSSVGGGVPANHIARWDGRMWHPLGAGVVGDSNSKVLALAFLGDDLYVGGLFSRAGDVGVQNIARWDGTTWHALGAGVLGYVLALHAKGTDLYVGGGFLHAGDLPISDIARWDGQQWHAVGGGVNGEVRAIASDIESLYIAGMFTQAGNVAARNIARWDGLSWAPLGAGIANLSYALAVRGSDVYVGFEGALQLDDNHVTVGIARWDGRTWQELGGGVDNTVFALAVVGSDLYVGGGFGHAGAIATHGFARWNGTTWSVPGGGVSAEGYALVGVEAIAIAGSSVYVGGPFIQAGDTYANAIARWNGATWSALGNGVVNAASESNIYAIVPSADRIYIGGQFSHAGGTRVNNVAQWNGIRWQALGSGIEGVISTIAVSGTDVYVGGTFASAGGVAANNIARWDGVGWHALGSGVSGPAGAGVYALAFRGTDLYVGGFFTKAGSADAASIARWDGSSWSPLGAGVADNLYASVNALAVRGTDLYVGGVFTSAGGTPARNIARWDGSAWYPLGSGLGSPDYPSAISALAVQDAQLYAGGYYEDARQVPIGILSRWDGTTWTAVGGSLSGVVSRLAVDEGGIYLGGNVFTTDSPPQGYLIHWDGSRWSSLGSGVDSTIHSFPTVSGIALSQDALYVGGSFDRAGAYSSHGFARWSLTSDPQPPGQLRIDGVSPLTFPAHQATPILIRGANFVADLRVYIGDSEVQGADIVDPSTIAATVPANLIPGRYQIRVVTPDGTRTLGPFIRIGHELLLPLITQSAREARSHRERQDEHLRLACCTMMEPPRV